VIKLVLLRGEAKQVLALIMVSPEPVGVSLERSIREEYLWREQPKLRSSR